MREFVVELGGVSDLAAFVEAVNEGLIRRVGGEWHGRSWDAFHDYLSWAEEEWYRLVLRGWSTFEALTSGERATLEDIFRSKPKLRARRNPLGSTCCKMSHRNSAPSTVRSIRLPRFASR